MVGSSRENEPADGKTEPAANVILAADQRLSQSLIWHIQRQYFLKSGLSAWQDDVVPHHISSNPFMARAYSQVIMGYLRDCKTAERPPFLVEDEPIYIVELGSGSGRLAYHFLNQFYDRFSESTLAGIPVKFIMTDFAPAIVETWQANDHFRPWVEAGLLDFALFDTTSFQPLTLLHDGRTLTADQIKNPLILIANYFFDSIPQDSFVIEAGQVMTNLLSVYSSQPENDLADPTIWERLELAYEAFPLEQPYYDEPLYNDILEAYAGGHWGEINGAILFPNIALDCLRWWQELAQGQLLLLSSDKGFMFAEDMAGQEDPLPALHGSFSFMVNYHAVNVFVEALGGLALYPRHYQSNLQVAAYILGKQAHPLGSERQDVQETRQAFRTAVIDGGPDDFFSLKQALEGQYERLTLPQLLSCLRLSYWDATIFGECYPALLAQVQTAPPVWYPDVRAALEQIRRQYLPLAGEDPLLEAIDQLLGLTEASKG